MISAGDDIMSVYKVFFSPTGGTKKVADCLCRAFDGDVKEVDLSLREAQKIEFDGGDTVLVAVPSFSGRVPAFAVDAIKKLKANGASAVAVVVYGNRAYDDTLIELQDVLLSLGFKCKAAVAAVAEHSIMHCYGAGRPDAEDIAELKEFSEKIKNAVANESKTSVDVPGNRPYKPLGKGGLKPFATDGCVLCGECSALCPVGAISVDDPKSTDEEKCISCMRCVSVCPQKARKVDDSLLAALTERLKDACSSRKKNEIFL